LFLRDPLQAPGPLNRCIVAGLLLERGIACGRQFATIRSSRQQSAAVGRLMRLARLSRYNDPPHANSGTPTRIARGNRACPCASCVHA